MDSLNLYGKTIAFLATDGFEQVELTTPWKAIEECGGTCKIVSPKNDGTIRGCHHDQPGDEFVVDVRTFDAVVEEYDALVLPGGLSSPDTLRLDDDSIQFIRGFFLSYKPVAAICHAPWLLIEAGVVNGKRLTSWPSLKTDIFNAGGTWLDEACVCDQGLITSRSPADLPIFCKTLVAEFGKGIHAAQDLVSETVSHSI